MWRRRRWQRHTGDGRRRRVRIRRHVVGQWRRHTRRLVGERRGDPGAPATQAQTAAQSHLVLAGANRRAREGVRAHALSGRVCARTPRAKDHAARGAHPGLVLEQARQVATRREAPQSAHQSALIAQRQQH